MSLQRANTAFDRAEFAAAAEDYQEVLRVTPSCCTALVSLAACFYHLGERAEAADFLTRALRVNDAYVPALLNMSLLLNDQRRAYESLAFSGRALLLQPNQPVARLERAYSLLLCGLLQEALEVLAGLELSGFFGGRLRFVRGLACERRAQWRDAESEYVAALEEDAKPAYACALSALRDAVWRRRVPLLALRDTSPLLVGLDDNLFRLVIKHC